MRAQEKGIAVPDFVPILNYDRIREVVTRLAKHHHAGLILATPDSERLDALLRSYMQRFREDFHASMPAQERARQ
ncbi:MAG: hypothetical protein KY464_09745 [Gemmatimonadetes bacterium]|nr:hypothetical protein [Gemmatimonadota bacterium]